MVYLVYQLLNVFSWIIIGQVILSWLVRDPRNPVYKALNLITEPVLGPLRKLVPPEKLSGLDISPMIAFLAIRFLQRLLIQSVY